MTVRTGSVRAQRAVVLVALLLLATTLLSWPEITGRWNSASGQAENPDYQPYQCSQPGVDDPHQRRQHLQLDNGNGNWDSGAYMYPCVSGVAWRMSAGDVTNGGLPAIARISKVYAAQADRMYFAGVGSRDDLYKLAFNGLVFCSGDATPIDDCPPGGVTDISLSANSADTYQGLAPRSPYTLGIDPDQAITIGGAGVTTEVWATGNSSFTVPKSEMPCVLLILCGSTYCSLFGTSHGDNCEITMSSFSSDLVQLLAEGSDWSIIGLDLEFYYLTTHAPNTSDPYTQPPVDGSGNPLNSIRLPNTGIGVQ